MSFLQRAKGLQLTMNEADYLQSIYKGRTYVYWVHKTKTQSISDYPHSSEELNF